MNYLDSAATSSMRQEALDAYIEAAQTAFGNTQSLHDYGTKAAEYLASCKVMWGKYLHVRAEGIYFTATASEGNKLAIRSILRGRPTEYRKIITTKLEHASVLITLQELQKEGYEVHYVPVDSFGVLNMEGYKEALNDSCALVVMQLVNSEMGAIQAVAKCTEYAREIGVPVHCDIVQAFGKIPVDVSTLGATSVVCSGHKIGGPKGVGIVYIDPTNHWESVYEGTTHQNGFRPGTIDVPAIVAATIAAKYAMDEQKEAYEKAIDLQDFMMSHLPKDVQLVGHPDSKSPFIQGLIMPRVEGQWMMLECNRQQIAISTGTACKIGYGEAMSAMSAIGYENDVARRFVRISFSKHTTRKEIKAFLQVVNTSLLNIKTKAIR